MGTNDLYSWSCAGYILGIGSTKSRIFLSRGILLLETIKIIAIFVDDSQFTLPKEFCTFGVLIRSALKS